MTRSIEELTKTETIDNNALESLIYFDTMLFVLKIDAKLGWA